MSHRSGMHAFGPGCARAVCELTWLVFCKCFFCRVSVFVAACLACSWLVVCLASLNLRSVWFHILY